jgi:ABC-type branched-subunit amino acid transport system substrate-binding protein
MRSRSRRPFVAAIALVVLVAACGNSKSSGGAAPTTPSGGSTSQTTASGADLSKNVPRLGVKGVTDKTIRVAVITSKTNPVGGKYHQYIDGIKAYFKTINDAGGIYGRQLVVASDRDDNTGLQNSQMVTASLADDNAFATFLATLQFTGADLLAKANEPTFTWNINPEFASTPTVQHTSIFGTSGSVCFSCPGPLLPWLAEKNGFTKVGIVGYGVSAESKICAEGTRDAFNRDTNGKIKVAFFDETVPFAGDLSADVAKMKTAGVQLVTTCLDTNEVVKLANEMKKQGLNAVQNLPNAYDHDFLKANSALFEGSFVEPLNAPWETEPQSPATKAYVAGIKAITNDPVETTELGWAMAMMFVDGLKGAGPEFTQQKVIDWLNSQKAYSAGGLLPAIDWTTGHIDPQKNVSARLPEQCQPVLKITGGKFVPFLPTPGKPFTCVDTSKDASQTPVMRSFAPGGVG